MDAVSYFAGRWWRFAAACLPRLSLIRLAVGAVSIVMLARAVGDFRLVGFFKTVRGSTFARMDTRLYSPLCVLLGIGMALIA